MQMPTGSGAGASGAGAGGETRDGVVYDVCGVVATSRRGILRRWYSYLIISLRFARIFQANVS